MRELPDIRDHSNVAGKRVLLRAGLNVPIVDGNVVDDFRISRTLETIRLLVKERARVVIVAHLGRDPDVSLRPVAEILKKHIDLTFVDDLTGPRARHAVAKLGDGEVLLLENVRSVPEESTNDKQFAETIAHFGELFVNDAFSDSHREHASIVGVPNYLPSYAGTLFMSEMEHLSRALSPRNPSLCIMGGAKFETKQPLVRKFLDIYDRVFVCGALANDFFKAKGYPVGTSVVSPDWFSAKELLSHKNLWLPTDVLVTSPSHASLAKRPNDVQPDEKIVDVGPVGLFELSDAIANSRFVLWNGPLGYYEQGFIEPTEEIARVLASSAAYSVVGGGDTVASIARLGLTERLSFVSTAGGAMLEFLTKGTLPGIEAILKSKRS